MMNVYLLLDRSASMGNQWEEALGSINGYVRELDRDTNVMLAVFDTISYDILRNTTTGKWVDVTREEASPRGGTPLFDSAARMMWRVLDDNPEKAVFVVMTDGEENNSHHFNQAAVKALTSKLTDKKYEVIFLGANFDKVGNVAANFGLAANKFTDMTSGNMREYMTKGLAASTQTYAATGQAINITAEDKLSATKKVVK